jgi:hypothetical protein
VIRGSPGLFDLPGGALLWLDSRLLPLPDLARVLIWAAIGSVVSMALYALLSPQSRLQALKSSIRESQAGVEAYAGDFRGALPLLGRQIGLNLRHVGLTLGPAVIGSLPVLFLLPWLVLRFGWVFPETGAPVVVTTRPARADLLWQPAAPAAPGGGWRIAWPAAEHPATLRDAAGSVLVALPPAQPVPAFTKRRWWRLFFGDEAGYLPEAAPVESVEIGLARRTVVPGVPGWLAGWELPFFGGMFLFSVLIKMRYRIH